MKKIRALPLALFVLVVFAITALILSQATPKAPRTKLLAILPLTGNLAVIGTPKQEAMQLALEEAKSRYPDLDLTIEFQDSQGNAKEAVSVLNQALALDQPDFLFVDLTSIVDATLPIIDSSKIPTFAGSAQARITERSNFIYRIFPGGDQETEMLTNHLKNRSYNRLFILHPNELYGRSMAKEFDAMKSELKLIGSEEYGLRDKDFRVQLIKARESGADVIALLGYGSEYSAILRQAKELGIPSNQFIANLGAVNIGVINLPPDLTEGIVFAGPAFALRDSDSYPPQQKLVTAYKERYGREPDFRVAFVYDSIMMLAEAISNSESINDVPRLLENLGEYDGTSGRISLTSSRDAKVEIVMGQYLNGKPEKISAP